MTDGMRILRMKVEHFKKVEVIDITPPSDIVDFSGPNGSGKSSALDCIPACLSGNDTKNFPKPIKDGHKKSTIELDLGEYIVRKVITGKTNRLEVTKKETGEKVKSPQSIIDEFMGRYSFDPLRFYELSADMQRTELLDLLGVTAEVEGINTQIANNKKTRGEHVTQRNAIGTQLPKPAPAHVEPIEISAHLIQKIAESTDAKKLREREKELVAEVNSMAAQFEIKQAALHKLQNEIATIEAGPTEDFEAQLNGIKQNNILADQYTAYESKLTQMAEHDEKIRQWDDSLKKLKNQRDFIISAAEMPIAGMSIGPEGLLLNGIPLKQISSADQIKVSVYLAMRFNPKLKVIRIMNGSLLDQASKKVIIELARKYGYQIWIETVADAPGLGFYMVEGEVSAQTD